MALPPPPSSTSTRPSRRRVPASSPSPSTSTSTSSAVPVVSGELDLHSIGHDNSAASASPAPEDPFLMLASRSASSRHFRKYLSPSSTSTGERDPDPGAAIGQASSGLSDIKQSPRSRSSSNSSTSSTSSTSTSSTSTSTSTSTSSSTLPATPATAAIAPDLGSLIDQICAHSLGCNVSEVASTITSDDRTTVLALPIFELMRDGCPFLKYGAHGYPHFRMFHLSSDHQSLVWYSKGKKLNKTTIDVHLISRVVVGQQTKTFARHKAPELIHASFSVWYKKTPTSSSSSTLDIVAKDANDFRIWVVGLSELLRVTQSHATAEQYAALGSLKYPIPCVRGRRSTLRLLELANVEYDAKLDEPEVGSGCTVDKRHSTRISRASISMRSKLSSLRSRIEADTKLHDRVEYSIMKSCLDRLKESGDVIAEMYEAGAFKHCDSELWRASVNIEALEHMVKVLKNA
jgi:Pleckstrin homology domain